MWAPELALAQREQQERKAVQVQPAQKVSPESVHPGEEEALAALLSKSPGEVSMG